VVDETLRTTTLAVTNVTGAPVTALGADAARQAVVDQLRIPLPERRVHGPMLVPAGSVVAPAGASRPGRPSVSRRLDRATWFLWIDDAPGAAHEHPTRFVFLDAQGAAADVAGSLTNELWWPVVTLPGAESFVQVRPPLGYVRDHGHLEPAVETLAIAGVPGGRFAAARDVDPDPNACAIVLYGSDSKNRESAFRTDANRMRFFLNMDLGVPTDQIFTPAENKPAVPSDLDKLITQVAAKDCKKLYFFFSGHGHTGGFGMANESNTDGSPVYDYVDYSDLAKKLRILSEKGVQFCVFVLACFSASAIPAMQEQGISGEIITNAGPASISRFDSIKGYFFMEDFLKCWRELRTMSNRNPTFKETLDWIYANGQKITLRGAEEGEGQPRTGTLTPQRKMATLPPIYIPTPGASATETITLPGNITLPMSSARVSVDDPAIATLVPGGNFVNPVFGAGDNTAAITVNGLKEGVTTYRFTGQDHNGERIDGEGVIIVGNAISVQISGTALSGTGGVGRIVVPPGAARTLRITHADEQSKAIVDIISDTIQVPASPTVSVIEFGLFAQGPGTARLVVTDTATGATQTVTVRVEGYSVPDVEVMVGETKPVLVTRSAGLVSPVQAKTVRVIPFDDDATAFADVGSNQVTFAPGATVSPIAFTGKQVGTKRWLVIDRETGAQKIFRVNVVARVSCVPQPGTYDYLAAVVQNPGNHPMGFVPAQGTFMLDVSGGQLLVRGIGDVSALVGQLNAESCIAVMEGRGTFAGRPVHVKMPVTYRSPSLAGFVAFGADGELPGRRQFDQIAALERLQGAYDQVINEFRLNDASFAGANTWSNRIYVAGAAGTGAMLLTPGAQTRRSGGQQILGYATAVVDGNSVAGSLASVDTPPPIPFELNLGQAGASARFLARGAGHTLLLADSEAVVVPHAPTKARVVRVRPVGVNPSTKPSAGEPLHGKSHYLRGVDPRAWRTGVPHYGSVRYENLYPSIDLVYHSRGGRLEYDYVVRPGGDTGRIRLRIDGPSRPRLTPSGDVEVPGADFRMRRPTVYQDTVRGRVEIAGRFVPRGANEFGFAIGEYDPALPLVIDPLLDFATYLGGSTFDFARAVAADASGVYVTGVTTSNDFQVSPGALQRANRGGADVFVAKLSRDGRQLLYATYVGGTGTDSAFGLAIDAAGNAFVAGQTNSTDFPVTPGAFQQSLGGGTCPTAQGSVPCADGFIFKLSADGARLLQSTYLGGNSLDGTTSVAIDSAGSPYVAGAAFSRNFPATTGSAQPVFRGGNACGPANQRTACDDAYVSKLSPDFSQMMYSTFLGGTDRDQVNGIAVDRGGNAVVVGTTLSPDFPATPGVFQGQRRGGTCGTAPNNIPCSDAFVTMINQAGSAFVWSTYLGGDGDDRGQSLALDPSGSVHVVGSTAAANFPVTAGVVQRTNGGRFDVFVANVGVQGRTLSRATYVGGSGDDFGRAITRAENGAIFIAVDSASPNFPGRPPTGTGLPILYEIRATRRQ
jgi:hypothetical protein